MKKKLAMVAMVVLSGCTTSQQRDVKRNPLRALIFSPIWIANELRREGYEDDRGELLVRQNRAERTIKVLRARLEKLEDEYTQLVASGKSWEDRSVVDEEEIRAARKRLAEIQSALAKAKNDRALHIFVITKLEEKLERLENNLRGWNEAAVRTAIDETVFDLQDLKQAWLALHLQGRALEEELHALAKRIE